MFKLDVDHRAFNRRLSDFARRQVPYATMQANNTTAWQVRQAWRSEIPRVFRDPVALTRNAVVYEKADRARRYAEIRIRDEAFKGTAPATYLAPQVHGGQRRAKRMEAALRFRGILRPGQFLIPAARTLVNGKLGGGLVSRMLSQLKASADVYANQSDVSRKRRHSREQKKQGYTTDLFPLTKRHGKLSPGIYRRTNLGRLGSSVQPVFLIRGAPTYRERYDIYGMAEREFAQRYPANFLAAFERALRNARS